MENSLLLFKAKLIVRPPTLCGQTDVTHLLPLPSSTNTSSLHQLLTGACSDQISEGVQQSGAGGTCRASSPRLSYVLMWSHCAQCGFIRLFFFFFLFF